MSDKISPRHIEFVRQYFLLKRNATAAYKQVYPACKTPEVNASRLLTNAKVLSLIKEQEEKLKTKYEITVDRIVNELAAIAFGHAGKVMNWDEDSMAFVPKKDLNDSELAFIESISESPTENGTALKMTTLAGQKTKALELLGKHIGMWGKQHEKDVGSGTGEGTGADHARRVLDILRKRKKRGSEKKPSDSPDGN